MPLAAGCALCGADLDTARFDGGPSLLQRLGSWFGAISFGPTVSIPALLVAAGIGYLLLQFL
jgi:hypothetical protein